MENDEGQDIYLKQFIQKQENMLLDFLRKNIDLEIRVTALSASVKNLSLKYEESQKQVEIQNEMMQQAAKGVESLTIDKKIFEQEKIEHTKTIEDLKRSLHDCKEERIKITQEYNDYKDKHFDDIKRLEDLAEEYRRQTSELNKLHQENLTLKSKLPINKRKLKTEATLPPDEF